MASNVDIKPGPPWEPQQATSAPVAATKWDLNKPEDRRLRSQWIWSLAFLAVIFAGFVFSIAFNFGQAARNGAGSGFGDTTMLSQPDAERFFETHDVPDSNH